MSLLEPQLRELATDVIEQFIATKVADTDTLDIIDGYRDELDARAQEFGQEALTDQDRERLATLIDNATAAVDVHFTEGN